MACHALLRVSHPNVKVINSNSYCLISLLPTAVEPDEPPKIVATPQSQEADLSNPVNLTCSAEGTQPISYQWFKDDVLIPGASFPTLYIPEVVPEDRGNYKCVATNTVGSVQSPTALVTIPGGTSIQNQLSLFHEETILLFMQGSTSTWCSETPPVEHQS